MYRFDLNGQFPSTVNELRTYERDLTKSVNAPIMVMSCDTHMIPIFQPMEVYKGGAGHWDDRGAGSELGVIDPGDQIYYDHVDDFDAITKYDLFALDLIGWEVAACSGNGNSPNCYDYFEREEILPWDKP